MSIAALASDFPVTRQAIAKHLRVMDAAGLAHSARYGRESVWRVDRQRLEQARLYLDAISRQWDDALDRLRAFVEG